MQTVSMDQIPTTVPVNVTAGDTLQWRISLADYPSSAGWVLNYRLINSGGKYDIASAADGDDHLISVDAATSAAYAAGTYSWQAYVTSGSQRFTVANGSIIIKPNLAAQSSGLDTRSHAKKMLAAIETWLESRDPGVAEYQIAGRVMKYIPKNELIALRSRYQHEVRAEEAADRINNGLSAGNRLLVRF
ncbi:hypothetical protein COW64_12390 [bacterium (Candidatus Blackallbacteria) CG18_big_fil_WC_8_21_14_2_50_49_26]|nr:MAG: hypothetical protein COW64_12390 [bacterium (Candidatus Blackallbacteria) CG18_big_fil_WC_8_21_14_2_50_49_26]